MSDVFEDHSSLVAGRPGGPESAFFVAAVYTDWKYLVQMKTNKVLINGPSKVPGVMSRQRYYGSHKIPTGTHMWQQDVPLPYLCYKFLLSGEIRDFKRSQSTVVVKKTSNRWVVHIASHQRIDELFTIDNLRAFQAESGDLTYAACGKLHLKFTGAKSEPDGGQRCYIISETEFDGYNQ